MNNIILAPIEKKVSLEGQSWTWRRARTFRAEEFCVDKAFGVQIFKAEENGS